MGVSSNIRLAKEVINNMGWRYVFFRSSFELRKKAGILKKSFPTNPTPKGHISFEEWKLTKPEFFFDNKNDLKIPKHKSTTLKQEFEKYRNGQIKFFNAEYLPVGLDYNWLHNPDSGFTYDLRHWTNIKDLSQEAGDIKYVWEKSRFSFLYTIIRYDYHFEQDCSEIVFKEIESWIDSNPINCGPNYICSQEISLRVLNWTFALYYYSKSKALNKHLFDKIVHSIYWQLKHVYSNINFSRIAVRNNHAITETMMIFLGGVLFPFFPESAQWKQKGKEWFETEVIYQVYDDGTFLQFSHNYHRVLIQLLTFALNLSKLHKIKFIEDVYSRAKKSLDYLYHCTDDQTGFLPNHGANDGALFFKLNNKTYRDFRPQLNALNYYFNNKTLFDDADSQEDIYWLNANKKIEEPKIQIKSLQNLNRFEKGGYFTIKEKNTFTFIKCGSYKDRPSHADNLHIDIWFDNENIVRDAGTYKYNTSPKFVKYFNGTKAHNTVTLGDHDQMEKGPRFIWYNWSEKIYAELKETDDYWEFEGKIKAFKHLGENISHLRNIKKSKFKPEWVIEDKLIHETDLVMNQYWNVSDNFHDNFEIKCLTTNVSELTETGYYSGHYGSMKESKVVKYFTSEKIIKTLIRKK